MKRTTAFLFAFVCACLTFAFASCDKEDAQIADPSATGQQVWLPYTMLDYSENCKRTYYYDEYGNEIKITAEDPDGNVQATWLCEYDDRQNLVKRSVDTGDGEPFVQLIQIYDDKGNLIVRREISPSTESVYTYQYDEQNKLVSESRDGQIIETYIYEADGSYRVHKANNADEYSIYRADGQVQERHMSSGRKWVYSYNEKGILTECVAYSGEEVTQKTVYDLDENGNAVKVIRISASGAETVLGEYEYKLYTVKKSPNSALCSRLSAVI